MRVRRMRGVGCLGCLPLGGMFGLLFPLILIAALVYWLVNRQRPGVQPPAGATGASFCPRCGKPIQGGGTFCPGCGARVG